MRVALACALALGLAAPALAATTRPAVQAVSLQPVTLVGSGFKRFERVVLTVRINESVSVSKGLRAGQLGRFRATFREHSLRRCGNELAVSAKGSRGSRASWVLNQPACLDD